MKKRSLQQLIEQARRVRDTAAVHVAGASHDAAQAQGTLDTLSSYLHDHLRGASARQRIEPTVLRLHERFTRKLDVAIVEQTRTRDDLQEAIARRREELIGRQRQLLAFETLQSRRDSAQARRRERADQRHTDEIAARLGGRRSGAIDDER